MIEVSHLTRIFRTYKKQPGVLGRRQGALPPRIRGDPPPNDINFSIAEGESSDSWGPTGRARRHPQDALGPHQPTSGTARVAGFDPTRRDNAYRRIFALVMGQKNQLWWDLPASESFILLRAIYGLPADSYQQTLDELLTSSTCAPSSMSWCGSSRSASG